MIPVRNNGESHLVAEVHHHEEQPLDHAVSHLAAQALRNPMGGAADIEEAEELRREPLSLQQVLALPEDIIRNLSSEQLAEVDDFFTNHTYDLFEMIKQQPGEIADKWAKKLYALGSNEFFARDGIHSMVICALIDGIRHHNLSAGWQAIHEGWQEVHAHSRRQFAALNTNQAALAAQDEAFDQLAEGQRENQAALDNQQAALDKMREDLREIRRRLLEEQEEPPQVDAHDVIAEQYAEPQAAAVERRDDPPKDDGWHPCWLIAAIIGCLAVAYGWFSGKGDAPKGE